jgi:hypothetical protein
VFLPWRGSSPSKWPAGEAGVLLDAYGGGTLYGFEIYLTRVGT